MVKQAEISALLLFQPCFNDRVEISTRVYCRMFSPSLLNYLPQLKHIRALRAIRVFVPYTPACLTCLCASRALLTRLTYAPFASFSRALHSLFVHVKILLECIFSPAKSYHFPRIIKGTSNCAIFKWVKKQP